MKYRSTVALGSAVVLTLSGCAVNSQTGRSEIDPSVSARFNSIFASDDPCSNNDRNIGIAAGVVAGSVIGYLTHGGKGAIAGAAIGAGGGFLIGHLMDNRRCALYKIAQENGLKLASAKITPNKLGVTAPNGDDTIGLDVQLQNDANEFVPGTAELTPEARRYFGLIALQYSPKQLASGLSPSSSAAQRQAALEHKVFIVGHTDERDSGSDVDLAALSQARAKNVARIFVNAGVNADNLYYQGAGDTLPIANNTTHQGQQENQRVEIVDVPTEAALGLFLARRSADPGNYRAVNASDLAVSTGNERVAEASASDVVTKPAAHRPIHRRSVAKSQSTAGVPTELAAASSTAGEADNPGQVSAPSDGNTASHSVADLQGADASGASTRRNTATTAFDFGGKPTQGNGIPVELGAAAHHSFFNLISEANAETHVTLGSCRGDTPHRASPVRNLGTGSLLDVKDSVPGFYGAPWMGTLNSHLIAVLNAKVPVDAGSPVPEPDLLIYRDYKGDPRQKPTFTAHAPVNVYRGSAATLYRIFVDGPMQCLDMVVPANSRQATTHVYYTNAAVSYTASGAFNLR